MTAPDAIELVVTWRRYAAAVADRAGRRFPWLADDLQSDCLYALFRAATRFDGAGDFKRYLSVTLRRAVQGRMRVERLRNPPAFRAQAGPDDPDPLAGAASREPPPGADLEYRELLAAVPAGVRDVIDRRLAGATFAAIGAAEGVSGSGRRAGRCGKRCERSCCRCQQNDPGPGSYTGQGRLAGSQSYFAVHAASDERPSQTQSADPRSSWTAGNLGCKLP